MNRRFTIQEIKERTLKPFDAWWVVFVSDPIAIRVTWLLSSFFPSVTPNQVTTMSLAWGLSAGAAFASGHWVLGGVLYQVAFTLDCVDGKLARLNRQSSARGSYFDGLVNNVVFGVCVVTIVYSGGNSPMIQTGGSVLLAGWALQLYTIPFIRREEPRVHAVLVTSETGFLRRHGLLPPFTFADKHALLFLIAPIIGRVPEVMVLVAGLEWLTWWPKARLAWRHTGDQTEVGEAIDNADTRVSDE